MRLTAKDTKMWKVVVPLIMGFKSTGALIFAITSVKMFLLKALAVSNVALMAAGFLIMKKMLSSVGTQHQEYLLPQNPVPYNHNHNLEGDTLLPTGIPTTLRLQGTTEHPVEMSNMVMDPPRLGLAADEGEDLQAHFSTKVESNIKANTTNHTSAKKNGKNKIEYLNKFGLSFSFVLTNLCRSHWPRGLRRGSAAAHLLGLWVRIPPGAWMSVSF